MYDYLYVLASDRLLSAHGVVLFGFLDDGLRLLWLLRLLLQLLSVSAAPVRK
jgi:hypothetical protein